MGQKGWVKLHRQMLDNAFLRHDVNARVVFITLLLMCDQRTGTGTFGRNVLAYYSGLKPTTAYNAFLRLKKAKMVTQSSNNKFTSFHICSWQKFQSSNDSSDDNEMTTRRQRDDTLQERRIKKKNIYKSNDLVEIKKIYDLFIQAFEKNPNTYKLTDKRKTKIRQRLKDAGYEMLAKAIKNTAESEFHRGDNDRGWKADLDFITRSYEQVERLSQLDKENKVVTERAAWFYD